MWAETVVALICGALVGAAATALSMRRAPRQPTDEPGVPLAQLPVAVLLCDADFTIERCNDGLTALLGYPPDIAVGLRLTQLVIDGERPRVKRRLAAVSGPPASLQVRCRRVDGDACATVWKIHVRPEGGAVLTMLPRPPTSTDRVARVSASLREPLMTLVGTAEQLSDTLIPASMQESVATIARSALQLTYALDELTRPQEWGTTPVPVRSRHQRPTAERRRLRVLVVEDNTVNATVLRRSLSRLGVSCELAVHGRQALQMLRASRFDAVLMDCQMPVMDGYEATRQIRREPSLAGIPVIAVTAHALEEDRQRCLRAGMDDHITKPVRLESLRTVLQDWTGPLLPKESAVATATLDLAALSTLEELLGSDFVSTVHLFLTDGGEAVAGAEQAFVAEDWDELGRRVHSLKSTSSYVGAGEVSDTCERLVRCAREQNAQAAPELLQHLRASFMVASQALTTRLAE